MRRHSWLLALCFVGGLVVPSTSKADETGSAMADAARRFVGSLDDKQKAQATFTFDSPERFNWHWIPRERKGLPIKELQPAQRALAFGLLNTGLSTRGNLKATTIMSFEEILRVEEHGTGPVRDPELYFISVFGEPSNQGDWAWRVEGHHLALNFTLRNGRVISATPFMFGSNPANVRDGARKGLRNLGDIEVPLEALLVSLNEDQRKQVIANPVAPEVTTTPNSAQPQLTAPEGIPATQFTPEQRQMLTRIVQAYAENFPEPVKADLLNQIAQNESSVHFAWYGPLDRTKPHAFRVQGSVLFIDFNNTQNEVNHIHTFFRSQLGDFGLPPKR
ncbi:DUF3500 domain-containing protein [Singulisphaera sp. PoT]|uniref:DUF3500 domain-containing protein n=1 Tax=Singulisphaera sp. PoT TaxID=3411797 RepID=UPI003BF608B7